MRIHVLGVGSIGSLVSFHLHQSIQNANPNTRHALSLILSRKGLPQPKPPSIRYDVSNPDQAEVEKDPEFSISVEADGQIQIASGFETEFSGPALDAARTQVRRLRHIERNTGSWQRGYVKSKIDNALNLIRGHYTPSSPISSLIVTLKCQDTLEAIEQLAPRIQPDTCITLLQNGMGVYDQLCERVWPDPETRPDFILGSTTHGVKTKMRFGVERDGDGDGGGKRTGGRMVGREIIHTGLGKMQFGVVPDPRGKVNCEERLWPDAEVRNRASVVALPDSPLPPLPNLHPTQPPYTPDNLSQTLNLLLSLTDLSPSLLPIHLMQHNLLLKLAVNCAINPLTAIYQIPNGQLVGNDALSKLVRQICYETSAVILAYFNSLSTNEHHDPSYVAPADYHPPVVPSEVTTLFSHLALRHRVKNVATTTATNTSSMWADILAARTTEIDFINGYMVQLGKRLGVPTPINKLMVDMVKAQSNLGYRRKMASRARDGKASLGKSVKGVDGAVKDDIDAGV